MKILHPSKKVLRRWLGGESTVKTDAHVAICHRCAETIEKLDGGEIGELTGVLAVAFQPPADLSERLEIQVEEKLDSRFMFDVVSDLFGAGIETSRLLILEEADE